MGKTDKDKELETTKVDQNQEGTQPSIESAPAEKTKKQKLQEMLSEMIEGYNPDDEESSSESVINFLNSSNESKKKISDALLKDPRLAQMFSDIISGKRGAAGSAVRYFGKDFLSAEEGSAEYEEIVKAEEERKKEQEASEAKAKEYNDNLEKSIPLVEKFCKDKGYNVDEFLNRIWDEVVSPICSGMYTEQLCNIIDKGLNYDQDVDDAMKAGEIRGRNENIHKLKEQKGDGMPSVTGSEFVEQPKRRKNAFLELAGQA